MTPIKWKSYRWNQKYITVKAFADIPTVSDYIRGDYPATFTIDSKDHDGLYSMERIFLECYTDPTEYLFVQTCFEGDIKHWEVMKNSPQINKYYVQWKQKAEAKLISEAMLKIVTTAFDDNNKNSFTALKYLVDRGSKGDSKRGVGRPKKEKEADDGDSKVLLEAINRLKD